MAACDAVVSPPLADDGRDVGERDPRALARQAARRQRRRLVRGAPRRRGAQGARGRARGGHAARRARGARRPGRPRGDGRERRASWSSASTGSTASPRRTPPRSSSWPAARPSTSTCCTRSRRPRAEVGIDGDDAAVLAARLREVGLGELAAAGSRGSRARARPGRPDVGLGGGPRRRLRRDPVRARAADRRAVDHGRRAHLLRAREELRRRPAASCSAASTPPPTGSSTRRCSRRRGRSSTRVPQAYAAAKAINSVVVSLAAIPAYLLARRVLSRAVRVRRRRAGDGGADAALRRDADDRERVLPGVPARGARDVHAGSSGPTWKRTLLLLGAVVLAYLTRAQAVAFLPAIATAPFLVSGRAARCASSAGSSSPAPRRCCWSSSSRSRAARRSSASSAPTRSPGTPRYTVWRRLAVAAGTTGTS